MLTDIQKSNIKSLLEENYGLIVNSIRTEQNKDCYKVLCEYDGNKIIIALSKNRENDKYRLWINLSAYLFVPKLSEILNTHKQYQSLVALEKLVEYSAFSMKHYIKNCYLADSEFLKKQKHVPEFEIMTFFEFENAALQQQCVTAGVTTFKKNETSFEDKFAFNMYRRPYVRPVDHVDFNISFKNKNDNMKMVQDVVFSNYVKYMNFIKKFSFEHDDINEIIKLDHVEAAYRINANFTITDMVAI